VFCPRRPPPRSAPSSPASPRDSSAVVAMPAHAHPLGPSPRRPSLPPAPTPPALVFPQPQPQPSPRQRTHGRCARSARGDPLPPPIVVAVPFSPTLHALLQETERRDRPRIDRSEMMMMDSAEHQKVCAPSPVLVNNAYPRCPPATHQRAPLMPPLSPEIYRDSRPSGL
jgi:hypothetical protein